MGEYYVFSVDRYPNATTPDISVNQFAFQYRNAVTSVQNTILDPKIIKILKMKKMYPALNPSHIKSSQLKNGYAIAAAPSGINIDAKMKNSNHSQPQLNTMAPQRPRGTK